MKESTPIQYERPTMTTYGTVRELTLGSGGTQVADAMPCTGKQGIPHTPSGLICKSTTE